MPLARGSVLIDTLHPHYEGHAVNWQAADGKTTLREYGFSSQGEAAERWQRSPFYRMVQTGEPLLRRRVNAESQAEFPVIADLAAGMTDFVAMVHRFAAQGIFGEMDFLSIHRGRRTFRTAFAMPTSPILKDWCRSWRWR